MTRSRRTSASKRLLLAATGTAAAGVYLVAPGGPSASAATLPPGCVQSGGTVTCTYTADTTFTVPAGITSINLTAVGGNGGAGGTENGEPAAPGGAGAELNIPSRAVSPGQTLTINIGGNGADASTNALTGGAGGAHGGGQGGDGTSSTGTLVSGGGGGGGATSVTAPAGAGFQTLINAAGGGGGGGDLSQGNIAVAGAAGGAAGQPGGTINGGNAAAPGSATGAGGNGSGSTGGAGTTGAGGGGGGFYGGGGGTATGNGGAGGFSEGATPTTPAAGTSPEVVISFPAAAVASDGPVTGAVTLSPPPIRSLAVSVNEADATSCFTSLQAWIDYDTNGTGTPTSTMPLPNGYCVTPTFTVTNGAAAGHVFAQGSDATGSGGAATGTWSLTGNTPQADQYNLDTIGPSNTNPSENSQGTTAGCDLSFDYASSGTTGCTASAGQAGSELIGIDGPTTSSGSATTYDYTATWTAVP